MPWQAEGQRGQFSFEAATFYSLGGSAALDSTNSLCSWQESHLAFLTPGGLKDSHNSQGLHCFPPSAVELNALPEAPSLTAEEREPLVTGNAVSPKASWQTACTGPTPHFAVAAQAASCFSLLDTQYSGVYPICLHCRPNKQHLLFSSLRKEETRCSQGTFVSDWEILTFWALPVMLKAWFLLPNTLSQDLCRGRPHSSLEAFPPSVDTFTGWDCNHFHDHPCPHRDLLWPWREFQLRQSIRSPHIMCVAK